MREALPRLRTRAQKGSGQGSRWELGTLRGFRRWVLGDEQGLDDTVSPKLERARQVKVSRT